MSKQAKTYVLLAVVLVIWGLIGVKVVGALSPDMEAEKLEQPTVVLPRQNIKKDTFQLIANYRDPFLGTFPKSQTKKKKTVSKQPPKVKKNIVYSGSVSATDNSGALFFVTIDGQQFVMSKRQEENGVKLLSGNNTSIRVRYDGISETVQLVQ